MATLKQRLHKKNSSGVYDTIHLETSADLVLMTDGSTKLSDKIGAMDTAISGKAAASHTHTTISGNAGTATKLKTARTIRTNLGATTTASFDGSANITPGITGTLGVVNGGTGVTSIAALKAALGIGAVGEVLADVPTTLGSSYRFAGYDWTVVHVINNLVYAVMTDIYSITKFGDNAVYAGSTLVECCEQFQNNLTAAEAGALAPVTMEGVILKVFVPSRTQIASVDGSFDYFSGNAARIANYNGTATKWWTSSHLDNNANYGHFVTEDGYYTGNTAVTTMRATNTYGFRPCIAFKR